LIFQAAKVEKFIETRNLKLGKEVKIVGFGINNSAVVRYDGRLFAVPLNFLENVKDL